MAEHDRRPGPPPREDPDPGPAPAGGGSAADDRRVAAATAALDVITEVTPAAAFDGEPRHTTAPEADPLTDGLASGGAMTVLRRALAATPELRRGLLATVGMATATAVGKLTVPVLIQQTVDRGLAGPGGFRPGFVWAACAATVVVIGAVYAAGRATYLRLVRASEDALWNLRVRAFDHIGRLSMADLTERRRGALVTRVTSDIDQIARFAEWGGVAWIVNSVVILGTVATMVWYSPPLAAVVVVVLVPLAGLLRALQRRQLQAYDRLRTAVGDTLGEVGEAVSGAALIRAYDLRARTGGRLEGAIDRQYRAQMGAARYFALMFPLADVFAAVAVAAVVWLGATRGVGWGLAPGEVVAFLFLAQLLQQPVAELTEILESTQTALAGWRKVLLLLDVPVEVPDPVPGRDLPDGPLEVRAEGVRFAYRTGPEVLRGVDLHIPAGSSVAIVGETGSGKTTFASLLCRLADPTAGRVLVGGVDLREVSAGARRRRIRMVPQDGFLFDTTVRENVRFGRPDATDAEVEEAFRALGLTRWLERLPAGLDTPVGERGANLSVGERQLVALARAQLADPGLLILDEATSSVDPATERILSDALVRLTAGRTTVSVAHRLSTAEAADTVVVFDGGRIIEMGPHAELVAAGGRYAELHASWVGATRTGRPAAAPGADR